MVNPKPAAASPSRSLGETAYAVLANTLRQRIYEGEWKPGAPVPAESDLARQYGVALGTMRKSLALLVADRLLIRKQGRGTTVSAGLTQNSVFKYLSIFAHLDPDEVPGARFTTRRVRAVPREARALFRPGTKRCLLVERLRTVGQRACTLESVWLPLPLFQPLADLPVAQWGERLYPLYSAHCGVAVIRTSDRIAVRPGSARELERLALAAPAPVAEIRRASFDVIGRCVEYRVVVADAYLLSVAAEGV